MDDRILVTTWLEPELVERIRHAAGPVPVVHEPELLRPPRYAADHSGAPRERTAEQEARWRDHLGRATILFDFDPTHREDLPERAPHVRWVQATSAGIGPFVRRMGYAERMPDTVFTTASGVHARPLAEFAALAMLAESRGLRRIQEAQRRRHWERYAGTDLAGRTVLVVGMGSIGQEVGRVARGLGMSVLGIKRRPEGVAPASVHADELGALRDLPAFLPRAEVVVLATPHTDETEGMMGEEELDMLPQGALLINVGRGSLVDESALVRSLEPPPGGTGRLAAAWLDVFETEPLPHESPLWDLPNVVVSPHSAATSDRENERIVELFCENLRRDRAGEPLLNVLNPERLY
ncbi:MAG: D-2-hydroxyacid dehydrogenase [Gemmatimonadota bacterium]